MTLHRFGNSSVRLGRVLSIRCIPAELGSGDPPKARVYFDGSRAVTFEGPDAAALLAYNATLPGPPPEVAPEGAAKAGAGRPKGGSISPARDPKTGKVLGPADGGREDVVRG